MTLSLKNKYILVIMLMAIVISITSCIDKRTYDHFEPIKVEEWKRNDTIRYNIKPQDKGNYQINLTLRATQRYLYSNISLLIEGQIYSPQKKGKPKVHTFNQVLNINIFNEEGRLNGKKTITTTEINRNISTISLHQNDSLYIKVTHRMNKENISGISDIGIKLIKQ